MNVTSDRHPTTEGPKSSGHVHSGSCPSLNADQNYASEILKHLLHQRHFRTGIPGGIILRCSNIDCLDDPVVNKHRHTLAPHVAKNIHDPRVVKFNSQSLCELTPM